MRGKKNVAGRIALLVSAALVGGACDDDNNEIEVVNGTIDEMDINGDLLVDQSEFNASFVTFDVNGNGVLTADEFPFNNGAFAQADLDNNGVIDEAEFQAMFATMDVNNDLVLEQSEFDPFL